MIETAENLKAMQGNIGKQRLKSLTSSTHDAFVQTLFGLVALSRKLLSHERCQYVLLGVFQSDLLEGEFGIYRQFSGGNYYIGVEQILSCAHFRRLQLYNKLDLTGDDQPSVVHEQSKCCSDNFTEFDLLLMDSVFEDSTKLSIEETSALYFVAGYVAFKEGLRYESDDDHEVGEEHSEFIHLVNRGKLTFPPKDLFLFTTYAYTLFKHSDHQSCANYTKRAFNFLYESLNLNFDNPLRVCQRLSNCFFKGLVRKETDSRMSGKKENVRRKRKLTGDVHL